jgi:nitrile hydratase subunit beta
MTSASPSSHPANEIVLASGERPAFEVGDTLRVMKRSPIGHYRVPRYLRGKIGFVEAVTHPAAIDNEEEAFGRNAGSKSYYYRMAFRMTDVWPGYAGGPRDGLRIEVFQTWLEKA